MRGLAALGALSLLASPAFADTIYLGTPAHGGSGCPDGTVSAILSPDAQSLSILFDEYEAETSHGDKIDRASCNVAVPVHVPQGFSVSLLEADYRGYAEIPKKAKGEFRVEYFFAGMTGPKSKQTFGSGYEDDFIVEDDLNVFAFVWSACGADVILRSNSSIKVKKKKSNGPDAYMAVDSADFEAGILYHLQWKKCWN